MDVYEVRLLGQPEQVEAGLAVVEVGVDGGLPVELGELLPDLALSGLLQGGVDLDLRLDVGDLFLDLSDVLALDVDLGVDLRLGLADRLQRVLTGYLVKVDASLDRGLHLVKLTAQLGHGIVVEDRLYRGAPLSPAELLLDLLQVAGGDADVRRCLGLGDGRLDAAQVLRVDLGVDLEHEAVKSVLDGVTHLARPLLGCALDALADFLEALLDTPLGVTAEVARVSADLYDDLADLVCHGLPSPLVRRAGGIAARLLSEAMIPPV